MKLAQFLIEKIAIRQASKRLQTLARSPSRYRVGAVSDREELEAACRLLYREYRRRGYCSETAPPLHFNPHMFAREARTFIITESSDLLGTISIFPDSSAGVPAEQLYSEEIASLRKRAIRFAEVGLLATNLERASGYSLSSPEKMKIVFTLFKIMATYALDRDISHLVILVNPRHIKLYKFLGFEVFGEVRSYHGACGAPALPMILDLSHLDTRRDTREWFLENQPPPETFRNQLAADPNAFAELFGESFHDFNERYNEKVFVRRREGSSRVSSAMNTTVRLERPESEAA